MNESWPPGYNPGGGPRQRSTVVTMLAVLFGLAGMLFFAVVLETVRPWEQAATPTPAAGTPSVTGYPTPAGQSGTPQPGTTQGPAGSPAVPTATPPSGPDQPHVVTIQDALTFDEQDPGTTSGAKTVEVSNEGGAPQALGEPSISGDSPDAFDVKSYCGDSLAAVSSCTVDVYFKPSKEGEFSASLNIVDGAGGVLASVQVSGTGRLGTPDVSVDPTSLNFDENNTTGSVTVSNNGQGEVSIVTSISGDNSSVFHVASDDCGSLEGGSSCTVGVEFSPPPGQGDYGATLNVADAGGDSLASVDLSATVSEGSGQPATEEPTAEPPPTEETEPDDD